ncbi:Predicted arabinose efflux permease, MFS family [Actinopolymorpha cephalotaxi]|uniref:MFS family permease n=1 Tax=Actinopolymorpha cephalotaxi TaxID=504797 RepID=A0A1I3BR29_9ACTN|nr:MFS transporter [Actinopolymorpha cephalotaxi]NYH83771.1 MFS family permease [Actinopolymorpha cephalotaxi]SFH64732.1 Predicted arabinose efflux permease, MFS family [Actinopolymorpha cephalotaxi]
MGLLRTNPSFALLCVARTMSFAGGSLAHMALVLYVASRGGGPAVATLLIVSDFSPSFLAPVLGSIGDRFDRRRLMIATQILQAGTVLAIAAWLPALPVLLLLVAVNASLARAFEPASSSAVPQLVSDADLVRANSMIGFGTYGLALVGPLGAAALTPLVGLRGVLVANAGAFLISVALLRRLPPLSPTQPGQDQPAPRHRPALWRDTMSGLRYVWADRTVRATLIGFTLLVACTGLDDVALVFLAKNTFHAGDSVASLLYAGADVGVLLGFLALTRVTRLAAVPYFVAGMAVGSLGNLLTGLSWAVLPAIVCQAVRGVGIASLEAGSRTLVQRCVPNAMQARVFANLSTAIGLAAGVSYVGGGIVLLSTSPGAVLFAAGAAGLLVTIGTAAALTTAARRTG